MNTRTRRADWSSLPSVLLTIIGERLDTRMDVLRLRAVCMSWRSTIPLFHDDYSSFQLKHPDPIASDLTFFRNYLTLTESTVYRLGPPNEDQKSNSSESPRGWLVKIKELKSGKFRLLNPLSQKEIRYYPEMFPKMLNLLDYRVFELSKAYKLEYVNDDKNYPVGLEKVIFSPNDSSVLVIYDRGKLAFLRLGDVEWTQLSENSDPIYSDIILYREKFYAIDFQGQVVVINSLPLKKTKISRPMWSTGSKKKFVQIKGDLYVFNRTDDENEDYYYLQGGRTIGFEIYMLNEVERDWVKVESLMDIVVFLGDDCSYSISAEELDGCRGNCIFFRDKGNLYIRWKENGDMLTGLHGHDIGLFNFEDCSISQIATCPGNFQAIWPPPTWFKSH